MNNKVTVSGVSGSLESQGISRRSFLKFCAITASSLCITGQAAKAFAQTLAASPRPTVIWLSFRHCTDCSESLLRSGNPQTDRLTVDNCPPGSWVLVFLGMARDRPIDEKAEEINQTLDEIEAVLRGDSGFEGRLPDFAGLG